MDVPILVCGCGKQVRAPGARPGRVGRCPACGGRLEVPNPPTDAGDPGARIGLADAEEENLGTFRPVAMTPARAAPAKPRRRRRGGAPGPLDRTPMADGLLPVQQQVERSSAISFLYPLRGAESLAVIAAIGVIAWIFTVLVPEYCIQAMKDASSMGASLIGMLFVLIAILPSLFLGPLFLSYWLQYLGRVLVSTAMGDCAPPRTPDRNFDGLFNGLSPWFIWLGLGLVVGLSPALWWNSPGGLLEGSIPWLSLVLAAAALPYILTALMLSFLHDHPIAATPWGVLYGLVRLGPSFFVLCGLIAAALGGIVGGLALTLWVRSHLFLPYLLVALAWWIAFLWVQMVVMRLLGVFYFHRKDSLRWNRAHPRWGVAWRL